jgi:hypothetical protein
MPVRVIPYATEHGDDFYKGTPKYIPFRIHKLDLWFDKKWIRREVRQGSRVIDIGEPPNMPPSDFYDMERAETQGYRNYSQDPQT